MKRTNPPGSQKKVDPSEDQQSASKASLSARKSQATGQSAKGIRGFQSPSTKSYKQVKEQPPQKIKLDKMARIADRHRRYQRIKWFHQWKNNTQLKSLIWIKGMKLKSAFNKVVIKWKGYTWSKLIQNVQKSKNRVQACQLVLYAYRNLQHKIRKQTFYKLKANLAVIKAGTIIEQTPVKKSRDSLGSKSPINSRAAQSNKALQQNSQSSLLEKMVLSQEALVPIKKLQKYDKKTFFTISTTELRDSCEAQRKRYLQLKNTDKNLRGKQFDAELLINVLINQVRALLDFSSEKQTLQTRLTTVIKEQQVTSTTHLTVQVKQKQKSNSFYSTTTSKRYQQATKEIETSDQEIKLILQEEIVNYDNLVRCLRDQIHNFKKNKSDTLILSRIRLSQIIINLVSNLSEGSFPKSHHHYQQIINELVSKVKELSTICQQIPQLQTFKRTLDMSQVSHEEHFIKIVDVLIALHHRINELMKLRPNQMQEYIDMFRSEIRKIQGLTSDFITRAQSDQEQLIPIVFDSKKGTYPQQFNPLHRNIVSMTKQLITERNCSMMSQQIIERLKIVVQLFWNVISGMKAYERQWKIAKANEDISQVQKQIILILDQCFEIVNNRIMIADRKALDIQEIFERKRSETSIYHEKLEEQINNLLVDFQNSQAKCEEYALVVQRLMRQKQDLTGELKDRGITNTLMVGQSDSTSKSRMKQLQNENKILKSEISQMRQKQNSIMQRLDQANGKMNDSVKNVEEELYSQINIFKAENKYFKQNLEEKENQIRQWKLKVKQLETAIDGKNDKLHKTNQRLVEIQGKYVSMQEQFIAMETRLKSITESQSKFRKESIRLRQQLKEISRKHEEQWESAIQNKKKQGGPKGQGSSEWLRYMEEKNMLQEKIITLNSENSELKNKISTFYGKNQSNIASLEVQINRLKQRQAEYLSRIQQFDKKSSQFSSTNNVELNQLKIRQNELLIKISQLQRFEKHTINNDQEINRLKQRESELLFKISQLQIKQSELIGKANTSQNNKPSLDQSVVSKLQFEIEELKSRLRQYSTLRQQNQTYRNKFLKDEAYILYLQEQVRSLEDVVNVLSQQQNILTEKYKNLANRVRTIGGVQTNRNNTSVNSDVAKKDSQINRLKEEISNLNKKIVSLSNSAHQKDRDIVNLKSRIVEVERNTRLDVERILDEKQQQINRYKSQLSQRTVQEQAHTTTIKINEVQTIVAAKDSEINRLNLQLQSLSNRFRQHSGSQEKDREIVNLKSRIVEIQKMSRLDMQRMLSQKQYQINNYKNELSRLSEQIVRQQAQRSVQRSAQISNGFQDIIATKDAQINRLKAQIEGWIKSSNHLDIQKQVQQHNLRDQISIIENHMQILSQQKNQQINALKIQLEKNEISLKQFYEQVIMDRDRQIDHLRQQINSIIQKRTQVVEIQDVQPVSQARNQQQFHEAIEERQGIQKYKVERRQHIFNIDGVTLQQLITRLDMQNEQILQSLNQQLRQNIITDQMHRDLTVENRAKLQSFLIMNKNLIDTCLLLIRERQQALAYLRNYPNPDHLTQFIFRILLFISNIPEDTPDSTQLFDDLYIIRQSHKGGQYFMIMEEFIQNFFNNCVIPRFTQQEIIPVSDQQHHHFIEAQGHHTTTTHQVIIRGGNQQISTTQKR